MESSLNVYYSYRERALQELKQLEDLSDTLLPQTSVSRAYYAVFYAMKAQLALIDVSAGSHKQTLIEFRRNFIKTKRLPTSFSKLLTKLFEMREMADYDVMWNISREEFKEVLAQVKEFVTRALELSHSPE